MKNKELRRRDRISWSEKVCRGKKGNEKGKKTFGSSLGRVELIEDTRGNGRATKEDVRRGKKEEKKERKGWWDECKIKKGKSKRLGMEERTRRGTKV